MIQPMRRMRRPLVAALLLTVILGAAPMMEASAKITSDSAYTFVPRKVCDVEWQKGTWFVKKLIRCAAHHYGVSAYKALHIAKRESRYRPRAYNSWSCAKGIYQHLCRYWPGRAYDYGFSGYSAYNARANIIVSMRMVRRHGWSAWGG
jgi:soluble lytic murein transglycosylase-like protein